MPEVLDYENRKHRLPSRSTGLYRFALIFSIVSCPLGGVLATAASSLKNPGLAPGLFAYGTPISAAVLGFIMVGRSERDRPPSPAPQMATWSLVIPFLWYPVAFFWVVLFH
jgi:hypothetical protein